jgi:hypothetical protein
MLVKVGTHVYVSNSPISRPAIFTLLICSGLERYIYSWPERVIQAAMTAVMAGSYVALYCYLYHLQPEAAVAGVVSWLRNSLSVVRVITLAVLAAYDKVKKFPEGR